MASIRKSKKLGIYKVPKYNKERSKLMAETRELVSLANRRLKGLRNAGYRGSWASKKLASRIDTKILNAWLKKGKIKVNKFLTNTQLMSLQKAVSQFLGSKTSTVKGIKEASEARIKGIQETLSDELRGKVSADDAEFYYNMFEEDDFNTFADKIGASTLWMLVDDAKMLDVSEDDWITMLNNYITLNDLDLREKAISLYNKYIL